MFLIYDRAITRRQQEILLTATRSKEIVSSLYPSHVVEKLLPSANTVTGTDQMREVIADLYPETTVLFAGKIVILNMRLFDESFLMHELYYTYSDVASFTAWSSGRYATLIIVLIF
jgi:hypothetical protein